MRIHNRVVCSGVSGVAIRSGDQRSILGDLAQKRYYVSCWVAREDNLDCIPPAVIVGLLANSANDAQATVASVRSVTKYACFEVVEAREDWPEAVTIDVFITLDRQKANIW